MPKHDFDPTTLRMFVAVCDERNIARAASREAVVPSAVSKRILALEAQLGVALIRRTHHGIDATAAGETLLRHAREILACMERLHAEVSEFVAGVQGSVRIFANLSALSELLPDDVGSFLAEHPTVRVGMDERVSSEVLRGVRDGAADFGICWDAADLSATETIPYRSDHLCVVVPPTHPLAARSLVKFSDTLMYDQIEILSGSIMQTTLRRTAAITGQTLRSRVQVSTFDAACRNVAAGLGLAIVPKEIAEVLAPSLKLHLVPMDESWAKRQFVICVRQRSSLTNAARALAEYLEKSARAAMA